MTPILFPFSYVSESLAETLGVFFDKIAAYQPIPNEWPAEMRQLQQQGFLEARTPGKEDNRDIQAVIKDYQHWARLHEGSLGMQASLLKTVDPGRAPYFDDSATSRILAELKAGSPPKAGHGQEDPFFRARLFLHFAQEYDRHTQQIEADLDRHEEMIQNLIDTLKAEKDLRADEFTKNGIKQHDAPDDSVLPGRISAWTQMLLHDKENPGLFVTPSPAAFEYVKDIAADAEVVFHSDEISGIKDPKPKDQNLRQSFFDHLSALTENYLPEIIEELGGLFEHERFSQAATVSVCRIRGLSPREFFASVGKIDPAGHEAAQSIPEMKNFLIILVFSKKKR